MIIEPGSPASGLQAAAAAAAAATAGKTGSGKTRAAFYLKTTPLTRASRRLCPSIARLRHFCRKPGKLIDMKAIKADAGAKMTGMSEKKVRHLNAFTAKVRVNMSVVVKRLGQDNDEKQEWLVLTPKNKIPKPEKVSNLFCLFIIDSRSYYTQKLSIKITLKCKPNIAGILSQAS